MGNTIQILSPWTEGNAIDQLKKTAELKGMHSVAGMPDLHAGRGYPVGASFFSVNHLYPALIGNDIGCGMSMWQTDLSAHKFKLDKAEKVLKKYSDFADDTWLTDNVPAELQNHAYKSSLGSIGGGNHFAEFQKVNKVIHQDLWDQLNLNHKNLFLLVHSGSRGLGQAILRDHIDHYNHDGLSDVNAIEEYLQKHDDAVKFASVNRALIAERMLDALKMAGNRILDLPHNYVESVVIDQVQGWLHRKGATASHQGLAIVPGSRGTYSYLVMPKATEHSLFSIAHGAGRKWMRSECAGRLSQKYSVDQLTRTELGSRVICQNRDLLYEEAPEAYKDIEGVIQALKDANLIDVIAELSPVLTYKTSGER